MSAYSCFYFRFELSETFSLIWAAAKRLVHGNMFASCRETDADKLVDEVACFLLSNFPTCGDRSSNSEESQQENCPRTVLNIVKVLEEMFIKCDKTSLTYAKNNFPLGTEWSLEWNKTQKFWWSYL